MSVNGHEEDKIDNIRVLYAISFRSQTVVQPKLCHLCMISVGVDVKILCSSPTSQVFCKRRVYVSQEEKVLRHPCRNGIARVVKMIGFQNWDLENRFQLVSRGTYTTGTDIIFYGSQNWWTDSYDGLPVVSIQT